MIPTLECRRAEIRSGNGASFQKGMASVQAQVINPRDAATIDIACKHEGGRVEPDGLADGDLVPVSSNAL